jgi:hypothetical protein
LPAVDGIESCVVVRGTGQIDGYHLPAASRFLTRLRSSWQVEGWSPAALIDSCEEAISIENQARMPRWTGADGKPEATDADPS